MITRTRLVIKDSSGLKVYPLELSDYIILKPDDALCFEVFDNGLWSELGRYVVRRGEEITIASRDTNRPKRVKPRWL